MNARPLALACLALAACSPAEPAAAPEPVRVESSAERGPVSLAVAAAPDEVQVGQRLELVVDVIAEQGVAVEMPEVGDALGPFRVRAARTPPDVPDAGRRRYRHTYQLDTFSTGALEIPALTVTFVDRRGTEAPLRGELAAGPLPVTVRSILVEDDAAGEPRDIKGAVDVEVDRPTTAMAWIAIGLAAVAAAAIAVLVALRRRRSAAAAERVVAPHEWALARLALLEAEDLVGRGEFHEYWLRLSGIVREYIERRFGLMAPERTTDEFLREVRGGTVLAEGHRALLERFLRAADMVKFARHVPSNDDCRDALAAARGFVNETRPVDAGPVVEAAA